MTAPGPEALAGAVEVEVALMEERERDVTGECKGRASLLTVVNHWAGFFYSCMHRSPGLALAFFPPGHLRDTQLHNPIDFNGRNRYRQA